MNIKRAILKVFSANFIQLISGIIVGFVVPAILSLEEYANLKTYTLYMSYVGLLHFGFLDGMYIKYGGKKIDEIKSTNLKAEHNVIILIESIITLVLLIISICCKNALIFLFGISIIPSIISTFYKSIYQATGEFAKYSNIIYIYTITYTVINIILVFVFKSDNYIMYCLATFISTFASIMYYEYKFIKKFKKVEAKYSVEILNNIKSGFFILLGNLSLVFFTGADKWFVKIFLTTDDFAYYSFAVSMLNTVNILVNAISITFYNYLFSTNTTEDINKIKKYLIILGAFSSASYFIFDVFVRIFLNKYIKSLQIISITFATFPYIILINALFVNLYKINKDEKKYFRSVFAMLLVAILYNFIGLKIYKSTVSIALATLLAFITWTIYSSIELKKVKIDLRYITYLLLNTMSFLILSHIGNAVIGFIIYIISCILSTLVIYKEAIIEIISKVKNEIIKGRKNGIKEN